VVVTSSIGTSSKSSPYADNYFIVSEIYFVGALLVDEPSLVMGFCAGARSAIISRFLGSIVTFEKDELSLPREASNLRSFETNAGLSRAIAVSVSERLKLIACFNE